MKAPGAELPEPYELLDLEHGNSVTLRLISFQQGYILIHPTTITPRQVRIYMMQNDLAEPPAANVPISIYIPAVRIFGDRIDAPSPFHYWDVTSKRLQANLLPRLMANAGGSLTVTLTANGYKPTKVYSVEQGG